VLKKLFKHEFKNTYLEITFINIAMIVVSLLCALLLRSRSSVFLSLALITLMFLFFGSFIVLIMNIIKSFNGKMFTSEGYLTFTLPVSVDNILITKIITNLIWYIVTILSIIISLFLIFLINNDIIGLFEILKHIDIMYFPPAIILAFISIFQLLFFLVFLLFTLAILNIGKVKRYKMLVGIAIYFGLSTAASWIKSLFTVVPLGLYFEEGTYSIHRITTIWNLENFSFSFPLINFNDLLWNIALIIGLYIGSRLMIKHRLELE